jgi:hypothetical protein
MGVEIRPATHDDVPAILEMGRAMHAESPRYQGLGFDAEKVWHRAWHTVDTGGAFVAVKDGRIVGMVAGYVVENWFGGDNIASDYVFYLIPEERRIGRSAFLLWRAFEAWAAARGARDIAPGTTTGVDAEGTARFFMKLGYTPTGGVFFKRLH